MFELYKKGVGLATDDLAGYRGTSLIKNSPLLGPHSRPTRRALWWSWGGWRFLMSEVPLYKRATACPPKALDGFEFFSGAHSAWARDNLGSKHSGGA